MTSGKKAVVATLAAALFATSAAAQMNCPRTPGWSHWNVDWGWGLLVTVGMLLVLLLVSVIYIEFRLWRRQDQPLEILKKRYARGEISKEEFERMKKDLGD